MKIPVKKTTCALMAGAVLMSMTGCNLPEKTGKKDDLEKRFLETTEDYCDAVKETDADKLIDLSADDLEDKKEDLENILDFDGDAYSEDMGALLSAIADTIEYEIDEDSIEVDEKEGKIDVTFTVFDHENNEFDDDVDTLEEALDAVADGDTCEIKLTLKLEDTDDGWKVKDTEDITSDVYGFLIIGAVDPDYTFGVATVEINEDDVIIAADGFCYAIETLDVNGIITTSTEFERITEADLGQSLCLTPGATYSPDMCQMLSVFADAISFEMDEDSLTVDEDTGTAQIDVSFYGLQYYGDGSTSEEDFDTFEDMLDYLAAGEGVEYDLVLELELTDDGWLVSNPEDVISDVYGFFIVGEFMPDYEFGAASAVDPDTPTISGSEAICSGLIWVSCEDIDQTARTATAYADIGFGVHIPYSQPDGVIVDFTGYYTTIELNGELIDTVKDTVWIDVEPEEGSSIATGEYVLTFYTPDGTAYECVTVTVQ